MFTSLKDSPGEAREKSTVLLLQEQQAKSAVS
jgi:hypothetical protein